MRNLYTYLFLLKIQFHHVAFEIHEGRVAVPKWKDGNFNRKIDDTLSPSESIIEAWLDERCGSIQKILFFPHHKLSHIRLHFIRSDLFFFPFQFFYFFFRACNRLQQKRNHIAIYLQSFSRICFKNLKRDESESQFDPLATTENNKYYSISMFDQKEKKKK